MVALSSMVFLSPPSLLPSILPSSLSCCVYASNLYPLAMSLTVHRMSQWQQKQVGRSTQNLSVVGWKKPWTWHSMAWTWAPFSLILQLCTFGKSISFHVFFAVILMIVITLTCRVGVFPQNIFNPWIQSAPAVPITEVWVSVSCLDGDRAKEKLWNPYVPEPTKPLPDTTWMRLNTAARDSVHSSTKLKKSRSTWKGVQQIANTRTKTTGKGSGRQDDGVGQGGMWC